MLLAVLVESPARNIVSPQKSVCLDGKSDGRAAPIFFRPMYAWANCECLICDRERVGPRTVVLRSRVGRKQPAATGQGAVTREPASRRNRLPTGYTAFGIE